MGKPDAPEPPDPVATAAAQTGTNISTATANAYLTNPNIVNPDYKVRYNQRGTVRITDPTTGETYKVPRFTQTTTLSPEGRKVKRNTDAARLDLAKTGKIAAGNIKDLLKTPFDPGDLPEIRYGNKARNEAEAALMARMNPRLEQDRAALETRLANQGVNLGSAAYDRAMTNFGQTVNDARLAAILGAGQESDRIFNQSSGARGQMLEEAFAVRSQPINEVTALLSGSQITPQTFARPSTQAMPTVDYAGLVNQGYNQQMQGYNAQMQARNAMMGGLFDVASAGVGAYPW